MTETLRCTAADVDSIFRLANSLSYKNRQNLEAGFLLGRLSPEDYGRMVEKGWVWGAKVNHELAGYVIGMRWTEDELAEMREGLAKAEAWTVEDALARRLVWLDQIAVGDKFARRGIGRQLVSSLTKGYAGAPLASAVVEQPIENTASIRFHLREGFRRAGCFRAEEFMGLRGYQSGIFFRADSPARD
jgi:GNAT superfamily N-acetyltransferase